MYQGITFNDVEETKEVVLSASNHGTSLLPPILISAHGIDRILLSQSVNLVRSPMTSRVPCLIAVALNISIRLAL